MVYIRPSTPVVTPTSVKPAGEVPAINREHPLAADAPVDEFVLTPQTERRKQKDRREQRKDALFETRAKRDRRKSSSSISLTI
ncbi:MAG: hypothetical protein EOO52_03455 [Gammaproteobacteria bacterium]|nr:MAG: hypothetical protein EOO52_03455 [Gammaproteobacteria bacterium]